MVTMMSGGAAVGLMGFFTLLVHEAEEGEVGYWGEVVELPGCLSQGETLEELRLNIQEAIEAVLPYAMAETAVSPVQFSTLSQTSTATA